MILQVKINLDQIPQKYLFSLTVGFQAKPVTNENIKHFKSRKSTSNMGKSSMEESKYNENGSLINQTNSTLIQEGTIINPIDIENLDNQLDKANWYCCFSC
jgi:hypothetical protein